MPEATTTNPIATESSDPPGGDRSGRAGRVVLGLVVLVLGGLTVDLVGNGLARETPWVNHDVAFLDYAGQEILHGQRLYVEFDEVNPPAFPLLHAAAVAVARRLGIVPFVVNHLLVVAIAALGLVTLLRGFERRSFPIARAAAVAALLVILLRTNFSNNVLPSAPWLPYDFAQREHLFTLLFVPYLLWRTSGIRRDGWSRVTMVVLGWLSMAKPQWLVLVAVVEIGEAWRRRAFDRGGLVLLGVGMALPWIALTITSPASTVAFFRDLVPLILSGGYRHYGMSLGDFLASGYHLQAVTGLAALAVACAIAAGSGRIPAGRAAIFGAAAAVAYAGLVQQGKYWSYHGIPVFGTVLGPAAVTLGAILDRVRSDRLRRLGAATLLAALTALGIQGAVGLHDLVAHRSAKGEELVALLQGRSKVMILSMAADYAYAPVLLDLDTVGPWREHYRLAILLAERDPARRERRLFEYAAEVRSRIRAERPELLLFAPYRQGLPDGVHIHDVLASHGAIPEPGYTIVDPRGLIAFDRRLSGWIVYRRENPSGDGAGD